jgi:hypothetical protein
MDQEWPSPLCALTFATLAAKMDCKGRETERGGMWRVRVRSCTGGGCRFARAGEAARPAGPHGRHSHVDSRDGRRLRCERGGGWWERTRETEGKGVRRFTFGGSGLCAPEGAKTGPRGGFTPPVRNWMVIRSAPRGARDPSRLPFARREALTRPHPEGTRSPTAAAPRGRCNSRSSLVA